MRYFILVFSLLFFAQCKSEDPATQMRKNLSQRWKYDVEAIRADVLGKRVTVDEMEFLEGSVARFKDGYLEFFENGVVHISNTGEGFNEGTWDFSPDFKEIKIMGIYEDTFSFPLDGLTSEQLILGKGTSNPYMYRRFFYPAKK